MRMASEAIGKIAAGLATLKMMREAAGSAVAKTCAAVIIALGHCMMTVFLSVVALLVGRGV